MKKKSSNVSNALLFLYFLITIFLFYKTWRIFGFWNLVWTYSVEKFSKSIAFYCVGARSESNGKVTFNPKELPVFIHLCVIGVITYYLFQYLPDRNRAQFDFYFGVVYLAFASGLPLLTDLLVLFVNRNDLVEISNDLLRYRDNETELTFELSKITGFTIRENLTLQLTDGTTPIIPLSNMNFTYPDRNLLEADLKARLPHAGEAPFQSAETIADSDTPTVKS